MKNKQTPSYIPKVYIKCSDCQVPLQYNGLDEYMTCPICYCQDCNNQKCTCINPNQCYIYNKKNID